MNQAILFPDREWWDAEQNAICFPALINGFQVTCAIAGDLVASRYGGDDVEAWLTVFRIWRWELEEEACDRILEEEDDDQGWYWLS